MSDVVKKPKSSLLLYLLLTVTVLVLLCSAVLFYVVFGRRKPDQPTFLNSTSPPLILFADSTSSLSSSVIVSTTVATTHTTTGTTGSFNVRTTSAGAVVNSSVSDGETPLITNASTSAMTTAAIQSTTITEVTRKEEEETTTAIAFTTATTTRASSEQQDMLAHVNKYTKVVDGCAIIPVQRVTCPKVNDDVVVVPSSAMSPLHYSLNVTIETVTPTVLSSDGQIFIRMNERGNQITLNADTALVNTEDIHMVNCDTGSTLCVAKTVHDQREQLLSLILAGAVEAGTNLRVDIVKFSSTDNMNLFYVQTAPRWDRNTPVMIGTLLRSGTAKKIFPLLDNMSYRATLDLCVKFTPTAHVRSNAVTKFATDSLTCFERTVPLATQQMAFVGFENAEILFYNNTTLNGTYIPAVEIVFSINKNFKREKHEWIYKEACKVMTLMTSWTGFPYPQKALKFVSAPIRTSSHSSLGLITLQDRLVEHPSYTLAHVTLIHSVIQQWLPGLIGSAKSNESCFMESLSTYLEWKVDEELHIMNKTRATEIESIRPVDLSYEENDKLRLLRAVEGITICPKRLTAIFYTIDETFGRNTMTNIIEYMFRNFAYMPTTISDWQQNAETVTKDRYAGLMLSQWFSRDTRPILLLTVTSQTIKFEQITRDLWAVPVDVVGSTGSQLFTVTNRSTVLPYSSNHYVIADPRRISTAMIIYDVDSYLRLIRCWDDSRCPVKHNALRGIFRDLGAVLLADKLQPSQPMDILKWKTIFKFARNQRIFAGNAACCTEYAILRRAEISCTWIVRDTCEKIRFIDSVAI